MNKNQQNQLPEGMVTAKLTLTPYALRILPALFIQDIDKQIIDINIQKSRLSELYYTTCYPHNKTSFKSNHEPWNFNFHAIKTNNCYILYTHITEPYLATLKILSRNLTRCLHSIRISPNNYGEKT